MDQRRPAPSGGDAAVMAEYFETMRQFLETQERVMAAYMTGDAAGVARALPHPRRAPALPTPRYADPVAASPLIASEPSASSLAARPAVPQPVISTLRSVAAAAESHGGHGASPPKGANGANGAHDANGANGANGMNGANGVHVPGGANGSTAGIGAAAPAAVNGAAQAKEKAGGAISRDKLTDMLLAIVEEKTGYPRDMVGLEQSLESDLGIDSIKRIEVVGAMLQALPERYREALSASRSKLNTQATLEGMLGMMSAADTEGATKLPFDVAGTEAQAMQSLPSRHVMAAEAESLPASALRRITPGHFLVTEDALGLAVQVSSLLMDRACTSTLIPADVLASEERLAAWIAGPGAEIEALAGVIHLAAAGAPWLAADAPVATWRNQLLRSEKSLFILLRDFAARMADDAHVLSLSTLGGAFCRGAGEPRGLSLQGGAVGLLKSLREERPTIRVKAVDVDPGAPVTRLAAELMQELELVGGRQEVGYPQGVRTVFRTVPASSPVEAVQSERLRSLVVLATGGARGITAEALRELALPGNTLILTGRSPLVDEAASLAACATAEQVRQSFIAEVRSGASKLKPADIQRKTAAVMAGREMRTNIDDFRRRGATVEYHVVDVLDECALAHLIADVETRYAAVNGVVHGAGVIEDKLLADKTSESWSRVVETKVLGLLLLQRHLRPESLRFLSVFSSVAGRYGNSGQSDYATANELLNRLCCQLRDQWRGRVEVNALCWGPWGPTQFGAGMVTAETEAKFAAKGVTLVSAASGRQLFIDALCRPASAQVEVVCGQGPWEAREADVGVIEHAAQALADLIGPMLGAAVLTTVPTGEQVLAVTMDSRHAYLDQHRIDGVPVLPAAAAMALMGDAARSLWPGWKVVETREFRLVKGVEMKQATRALQVVIQPPPYGSSEGFEVNASIRSDLGAGRAQVNYRAVVRLEQQVSGEFARPSGSYAPSELSAAAAYDELLFHGPCFRVIEAIDGLSEHGSVSRVRPSRPTEWLAGIPVAHDQWTFDPALIDAAAQMAILWARTSRGETCLPTRFGRIVRLREVLPPTMTMEFELVPVDDPSIVRANVYFLDAANQVVLLIEEMECIASAALNRLGGTVAKGAAAIPWTVVIASDWVFSL